MNISPHLLIDAGIVSTALTLTLVLRAKGKAARKEQEGKWLLKKKKQSTKNLNYLCFGIFLSMDVFLLLAPSWFIYILPIYL